jgi:hypothetical protein
MTEAFATDIVPLGSRDWTRFRQSQLVRDPADAAGTGNFARCLGKRGRVVVVALAPGETRPVGSLGMAILHALGKDLDLTPALRQQDAWRLACAWLEAERTRALIVIGAEQFTADVWQRVDDLRRCQRADAVILVSHQVGHRSPRRRSTAAESAFEPTDPAALHAWAARFSLAFGSDGELREPSAPRFPTVPVDEAPYFRAVCRAVLVPADFALVNRSYRRGFDITRRWLADHDEITEEQAADHIAENVLRTVDIHERLTRLRGAQIAFLHQHWLLKVDLEAFGASHVTERPTAINTHIAERLRAYPQPKLSALAALTIATNLSAARLSMLNADQIFPADSSGGSYGAIDYGDELVLIEQAAHPFLRAHHIDRVLRGDPPDGPLFTTIAGRRMSATTLRQQLRHISQETGLPLLSSSPRANDGEHGHWMRSRGITLQPL